MSNLTIELALTGEATSERLVRFCEALVAALRSGAFSAGEGGRFEGMARESLARTASGVALVVPLPAERSVWMAALRAVFDAPAEIEGECPSVLVSLRGPHEAEALADGVTSEHSRRWSSSLPNPWPADEPVTVSIEFAQAVGPEQRLVWERNLRALEEVVSTAPFLACPEGAYSSLGESQVHWLGRAHANYWVAGVASSAPWADLLCNQLFDRSGPAVAKAIELVA